MDQTTQTNQPSAPSQSQTVSNRNPDWSRAGGIAAAALPRAKGGRFKKKEPQAQTQPELQAQAA